MLSASRHPHRIWSKHAQSHQSMGYASTSCRRRLSGSRYSHYLPPAGCASTSRRHRLSGSKCCSLPRVYVDSKPQLRHCLLAVSPSGYEYSDMKTKWSTRSSSWCWSCYGQAKEREQEDCGLAVHIGMMECSDGEVFESFRGILAD